VGDARTPQGFDFVMGTNYLGHFLLARHLLPLLDATGPHARVVCLS
jgi:NAD(P)-dependent dehydrogenase (short-subunit alcohol dehydrogenase family)